MSQREVGEDERASGVRRLWFANDIPVGRQPCEIASELLLDAAIEVARLCGREDRIAGPQLQREVSAVEHAVRAQAVAAAPRQDRHQLAERATIEQRATE